MAHEMKDTYENTNRDGDSDRFVNRMASVDSGHGSSEVRSELGSAACDSETDHPETSDSETRDSTVTADSETDCSETDCSETDIALAATRR